MKNKIMGMVIGGLFVAGVIGTVSAYSTQIWNPIQFVKKILITKDGSVDSKNATIVLDGTNGSISAKAIKQNGKSVADTDYVNQKVQHAYNLLANYITGAYTTWIKKYIPYSYRNEVISKKFIQHVGGSVPDLDVGAAANGAWNMSLKNTQYLAPTEVCNAANIGRKNHVGATCSQLIVLKGGVIERNEKRSHWHLPLQIQNGDLVMTTYTNPRKETMQFKDYTTNYKTVDLAKNMNIKTYVMKNGKNFNSREVVYSWSTISLVRRCHEVINDTYMASDGMERLATFELSGKCKTYYVFR